MVCQVLQTFIFRCMWRLACTLANCIAHHVRKRSVFKAMGYECALSSMRVLALSLTFVFKCSLSFRILFCNPPFRLCVKQRWKWKTRHQQIHKSLRRKLWRLVLDNGYTALGQKNLLRDEPFMPPKYDIMGCDPTPYAKHFGMRSLCPRDVF